VIVVLKDNTRNFNMRITGKHIRKTLLVLPLVTLIVVYWENIFSPFPMLSMYKQFEIAACSPCDETSNILPLQNISELQKLLNSYVMYRKRVTVLRIRKPTNDKGTQSEKYCASQPKALGKLSLVASLYCIE